MQTLTKTSISLLLCCSLAAPQAIFFSSNVPSSGGGSSINTTPVQTAAGARDTAAVAFGSNVGNAHLITVFIDEDTNTLAVTSISDTRGNSFVVAKAGTGPAGNGVEIWFAKNVTGGSDTVTVTLSGTGDYFVRIQEWAGASLTAPLDASAFAASSVPSVTTTLANELLLAGTSNTAITPSCTGYTTIDTSSYATEGAITRKAAGAPGSYNASCTTGNDITALVAFK